MPFEKKEEEKVQESSNLPSNEIDLKEMTFATLEAKKSDTDKSNVFKHAMKLVRCMVTCNNANKRNYTGEIFSVRNAVIPEVKKFVSFGVPTHIPQIMLNMIKEKQYQTFKTKYVNGNQVKETYLIPEYNIQELPPLTSEEFDAIKRKQLAEGAI